MRSHTSLLDPILEGRDGVDLLHTLAVFLLDRNRSITDTATDLFVHKNTVKYRLQKASDLLGFHVGDVLQSKSLQPANTGKTADGHTPPCSLS